MDIEKERSVSHCFHGLLLLVCPLDTRADRHDGKACRLLPHVSLATSAPASPPLSSLSLLLSSHFVSRV